MEQQMTPTLWLPSTGMCFLNSVPTMQLQPTSAIGPHQMTSQYLKQPLVTMPATNFIHNPHFLHQPHMLPTAPNIVHIPVENLLLQSAGKQPYEIPPPLVELPCQTMNLQADGQLPLPHNPSLLSADPLTFPHQHFNTTKVTKKKRISPSAKRRSRLRLIAFLEQKRKQQEELNSSIEIQSLQSNTDVTTSYPEDSTSPPSSDDVTLSPHST